MICGCFIEADFPIREVGDVKVYETCPRQAFGVSNKTAYQDVKILVELGMLQKVGQGKQTRYILPSRKREVTKG